MQTAERVSDTNLSDNFVFQRSRLAYIEAAKIARGNVLELGSGEGYGMKEIAPNCESYLMLDKYMFDLSKIEDKNKIKFRKMEFPPLENIPDNTFDTIVSFQVIEHMLNDHLYVKEAYRVLKPGGKLIVTTPNIKMSLSRNPWHIREYTVQELKDLLGNYFKTVTANGVFAGPKAKDYYEKNKESVRKIMRFDVLNLQYRLPRQLLEVPYDIMNRLNRKKLLRQNKDLTSGITMEDYYIAPADDLCIDLFYVAEK
jgi:ubiquinone/menaquinone biosynthesis C-methylase UbiE